MSFLGVVYVRMISLSPLCFPKVCLHAPHTLPFLQSPPVCALFLSQNGHDMDNTINLSQADSDELDEFDK